MAMLPTQILDIYSRSHLKLLSECYWYTYIIFPLKKNSPFTQLLNIHLCRVYGLIQHWHFEIIQKLGEHYMPNFYINYYRKRVREHFPISLADIQGGFYLLFVGYSLALIVFCNGNKFFQALLFTHLIIKIYCTVVGFLLFIFLYR